MPGRRLAPQAAQQPGDHDVLLLLGQRPPQLGARPGPLEQQRGRVAVDVLGDQPHGPAAVPQSQRLALVHALVVGPADLEHQVAALGVPGRGRPRALAPRLERRLEQQAPSGPPGPRRFSGSRPIQARRRSCRSWDAARTRFDDKFELGRHRPIITDGRR